MLTILISLRYTFKAEGARELGFKKKDVIRIRREVDANWIEGELNEQVGIFPRNYVDILDPGMCAYRILVLDIMCLICLKR